jgi:rsbT co-antagonist protein RsbR
MVNSSALVEIIKRDEHELASDWWRELNQKGADGRIDATELKNQTTTFLSMIAGAVPSGLNIEDNGWEDVRHFLEELSASRALQGFSAVDTALFVFSLRNPMLRRIRQRFGSDAGALADTTSDAMGLIDALGLHTIRAFQKSRDGIITRQQQELLELSTPVVKLWDGVLALPMIGTLDSARTQTVMESLLQRIVETGAEVAIIDITGVPTVDTLVAQHLLKTVAAIRLMGADCIISGIRPQIAQTIVHLGIELRGITTKATLADALSVALDRAGLTVAPKPS